MKYDWPVVVVVDDEPQSLAAIQRSLREEPYEVLATREPEQALEWVNTRNVSAVITDQRMPSMAGTDLLEAVSRKSPATVRIILTAYAGPTLRKPGVGRAVECVIAKPWDEEMLRRAIRGFFPKRDRHGRPDPLADLFPPGASGS